MEAKSKLTGKEYKKIKDGFSLRKCSYPECQDKAIGAHTLQKGGPLRFISDAIGTQMNHVYFLDNEMNFSPESGTFELLQNEKKRLKSSGIGEASMFPGFCDKHDKMFGHTIEDVDFIGTLEQCFLHSYRTFAYHLHNESGLLKGLRNSMSINSEMTKKFEGELSKVDLTKYPPVQEILGPVINSLSGLMDGLSNEMSSLAQAAKVEHKERDALRKKMLDDMILTNTHDNMMFCVKSFEGLFPIAAATVINYLDDTARRIPSADGFAYEAAYAITIFPEPSTSKTHFIIAALKETPNVSGQMKRFESLKDGPFLRLMSNLLLLRGTNTYLSPRLYRVLSEEEVKELINIRVDHEALDEELGIGYCEFHLFDKRFKGL